MGEAYQPTSDLREPSLPCQLPCMAFPSRLSRPWMPSAVNVPEHRYYPPKSLLCTLFYTPQFYNLAITTVGYFRHLVSNFQISKIQSYHVNKNCLIEKTECFGQLKFFKPIHMLSVHSLQYHDWNSKHTGQCTNGKEVLHQAVEETPLLEIKFQQQQPAI